VLTTFGSKRAALRAKLRDIGSVLHRIWIERIANNVKARPGVKPIKEPQARPDSINLPGTDA
jgi:hypothetical protein